LHEKLKPSARFEVLMVAVMKIRIFRDTTLHCWKVITDVFEEEGRGK
jgi:hypothetical protein